jgi:hypothetical protein
MRHKWGEKTVAGEGDSKVKTAECINCGLRKTEKREAGVHWTEWSDGGAVLSSQDGHKTPGCC